MPESEQGQPQFLSCLGNSGPLGTTAVVTERAATYQDGTSCAAIRVRSHASNWQNLDVYIDAAAVLQLLKACRSIHIRLCVAIR